MAAMSDYLENELLDHTLGKTLTNWTPPANLYVALFTASTNLENNTLLSAAEVSGNAYARTAVTFGAAVAGVASNSGEVLFPQASGGAWGTITDVAIVDSASGAGNILFHGLLDQSKVVSDGDTFKFNVGDLQVTLD